MNFAGFLLDFSLIERDNKFLCVGVNPHMLQLLLFCVERADEKSTVPDDEETGYFNPCTTR